MVIFVKGSDINLRKRSMRIDVMLNEIEYKKLINDVAKQDTTYSEHIRNLIMEAQLKEKPDYEFYLVMKELSKIGTNLNQLARKANTLNYINKEEYQKQAEIWKKFSKQIKDKYL